MEEVGGGCLWLLVDATALLYDWLPWPAKLLLVLMGGSGLAAGVVSMLPALAAP